MFLIRYLIVLCLFSHAPLVIAMDPPAKKDKNNSCNSAVPEGKKEYDAAAARIMLANKQSGQNAPKTYKSAIPLLHKAAEKGFIPAYELLIDLYKGDLTFNGINPVIKKDEQQAYQLAKKAAEKYPWGLYKLGLLHKSGIGAPQDHNIARDYLEQAGKAGFYGAYLELSQIFAKGIGIEPDLEKASLALTMAETGLDRDKDLAGKWDIGCFSAVFADFYLDNRNSSKLNENMPKIIKNLQRVTNAINRENYLYAHVDACFLHLAKIYLGNYNQFLDIKMYNLQKAKNALFLGIETRRGIKASNCLYLLADVFFQDYDRNKADQKLIRFLFANLLNSPVNEKSEAYFEQFRQKGVTRLNFMNGRVNLNKLDGMEFKDKLSRMTPEDNSKEEPLPDIILKKKKKKRKKKPAPINSGLNLNQEPLKLEAYRPESKPRASLDEMSIEELLPLANSDTTAMYHLGSKYLAEGDSKKGQHFLFMCLNDKTIDDQLRIAAIKLLNTVNPTFVYTDDFKYNDDTNSTFSPLFKFCTKMNEKPLSLYSEESVQDAVPFIPTSELSAQVSESIVVHRAREFEASYEKDMRHLSDCVSSQMVEDEIVANADRGIIIQQDLDYRLMKARFAFDQGGKSSGGRVYYIVVNEHRPIRFLRAFKKSHQEDLSPAELGYLKDYFHMYVNSHGKYNENLQQK